MRNVFYIVRIVITAPEQVICFRFPGFRKRSFWFFRFTKRREEREALPTSFKHVLVLRLCSGLIA